MLGRSKKSSRGKSEAFNAAMPAGVVPPVRQVPLNQAGRKGAQPKVGQPNMTGVASTKSTDEDRPSSLEGIAQKLEKLRFRKAIWGVSEQDVWRKIRRLDQMYCGLYRDQEVRYQQLLAERNQLARQLQQLRRG